MSKMKKIRDFFWPILDSEEENVDKDITIDQIKIKDSNIETAYDLIQKEIDAEEKRNRNVETKSTTFIWILGLSITILFSFSKFLFPFRINGIIDYIYHVFSFLALILILLYAFRSVIYAAKALKRRVFHSLGFKDFNISENHSKYMQKIITQIVNNNKKNSKTINEKVDCMVLSQEYFLRSIFSILILGILVLFYSFYRNITMENEIALGSLNNFKSLLFNNHWFIFSVLFIQIIIFILLIVIIIKHKQFKKR